SVRRDPACVGAGGEGRRRSPPVRWSGDDMHSPMEQFEIKRLLDFQIGPLDASYTNSALWMTMWVISAFFLFVVGLQKKPLVPGLLQSVAEVGYEFVASMVRDNVGDAG